MVFRARCPGNKGVATSRRAIIRFLGASPAMAGVGELRVALSLQSRPSAYADGQDRLRRPAHPLRANAQSEHINRKRKRTTTTEVRSSAGNYGEYAGVGRI